MNNKPGMIKMAGACALLVGACASFVSFDAQGTHFTSGGGPVRQVFCDMPEIRGDFRVQESRYVSHGTCVQLEGKTPILDNDVKRSEFDDYSHGKEIFRAEWTAESGYNALTKEAWEKIVFPAPTVDQRVPNGRPYGRFESKMLCATDPWIEFGSPKCTAINSTATGNLGDIEKMLRQISKPFTTNMKLPAMQALYDAHQRFLKIQAALAPKTTTQALEARGSVTLPEIIEPRAGIAYPPETPLKIRVLAPRNLKVQSYELQFESKQSNGSWQTVTNVRVTAAEVEGVLGYKGWGWHQPGTAPLMTAAVGTYRLRARATSPSPGEAGEWREFSIAGQPGLGPDVLHPRSAGSLSTSSRASVAAPAAKPEQLQRAAPSSGIGASQTTPLDWSKAAPERVLR